MRIERVRVEGFRLLEDVEIMLEPTTTVVVGRNNSGKTSLTDIFDLFVGENSPRFRLEDFSAGNRAKFWAAKQLRELGAGPDEVLAALPTIAITLTFRYDDDMADLGPLSPFVIDLDAGSTTAIARVEYATSLQTLESLLNVPPPVEGQDAMAQFYRALRSSVLTAYGARLSAIDPTDQTNQRHFDNLTPLLALIQCGFVRAQRTLDQSRKGDADVIGKLLGTLFKTASSLTAAESDRTLATALKTSVETIEKNIQGDFDRMLKGLLPALELFGFPSLNDTELRPETSLDVVSLLTDHTKIFYAGTHGINLPEGYNGLGTRNLIYMLLQLETFHKAYRASATRPAVYLVFIEEPEAHLHPQMQEVFIGQLRAAVSALSAKYPSEPEWQVQFVVSTHSPHVANAASFEAVRYFLSTPTPEIGVRKTKVKDFKKGATAISPDDRNFLHQYMTLTKCDLYFADKAILVEGATERILMPRLCAKVDEGLDTEAKLARQYITTIEVGGAYAHIFYPLLDFLELRSLVITDLDAVALDKTEEKPRWKKCPCANGTHTSNAAIKAWFNELDGGSITLDALKAKGDAEKTSGYRRIAYQMSEEGSTCCARSYEDALILANPAKFELVAGDHAQQAWELAQDFPKADTALKFAIQEQDWIVPRYIREGLTWLSQSPPLPELPTVDAEIAVL